MILKVRRILLFIGLCCFAINCDAANEPNTTDDKLLAAVDYSVLKLSSRTPSIEPLNLCILDFIDKTTSSKYNYNALPIRIFSRGLDLCQRRQTPVYESGYFVQELSAKCALTLQIDNFAQQYPNASGFIFATPCDISLRKFNLTRGQLNKRNFVVSVIDKKKLNHLSNYQSAERIKIDPSLGSRNSFICMATIFSIAVLCVFIGGLWGGRTRAEAFRVYILNQASNNSIDVESTDQSDKSLQDKDKGSEMTYGSIACAVMFTICVILSLYFFYKYIVYFFIAIFMLFSAIAFFECTSSFVNQFLPASVLSQQCKTKIKYIGLIKMKSANIPLLIISIGLPILWFTIRHSSNQSWIMQDLLCGCFCVFQLKILRLPSFKICFMLLFALFIYDIFFVFVTPYFTHSGVSIMEYVATGGASRRGTLFDSRCLGEKAEILPLSIRVPRALFGTNPAYPNDYCIPGSYSLLGLGDIIIPGILVSYCAAFDLIMKNRYLPYFWTSSIFYIFGLAFSYIALIAMELAQPALLYLVPSTVFSILALAAIRGQFHSLWNGPEKTYSVLHPTPANDPKEYEQHQ